VAYSNRIKENFLGVRPETLEQHGAVSYQTAQEMAIGIREKFKTDIGLSTTGIAGPTGGTPSKPVGLVWIGLSFKGGGTPSKPVGLVWIGLSFKGGSQDQQAAHLLNQSGWFG